MYTRGSRFSLAGVWGGDGPGGRASPSAEEGVLDLAPDLGDQMEMAAGNRRPGQSHVERLGRQLVLEPGALELRATLLDRLLELLAKLVQRHSALAVTHFA